MVFGFGGDVNIKSVNKFNVGINQDEQSWYSEFNYGCNSGGGCFGGGRNSIFGTIAGAVAGIGLGFGIGALLRGKSGGPYSHLRLGGIPNIFAGGINNPNGGYNPYGGGFLLDSVGSGFNNNPISIPGLQYRDGADGAGTATGSTTTDGTGKKGNAADNDGKTPSTDNDNNKGKTPSTDNNNNQGKTPSTDNDNKKPGSTSQGGDGNIVEDLTKLTDDQKTKAKAQGSALLNAVNDKASDGSTDRLFAGVFNNNDKGKTLENGATLKQGDETRKDWHKGTATTANEQDYKDAVKVGDAKGNNTGTDATTGAPEYFTMTDYRSGNKYSFKLYGYDTKSGKLQYKVDTQNSDLSSDNNGINGKNWEFADGAGDLVFEVNINDTNGEIELTYDGNKVSTDKLVKQKK